MRHAAFLLTLCAGMLLSLAASAQERAWVQIEAQPTLTQAETRARAYAQVFPDVAGFRMTSGWYAIVLGPYSPDAGLARLAQLRSENLIPADSFIAAGQQFRQPYWPIGADPAAQPVQDFTAPSEAAPEAAPPALAPGDLPAIVETPLDGATDNAQAAPAETAPAPAETDMPAPLQPAPALPDETLAEARQSESRLTRSEREELQSALKWFGHYTAAIDGAFGPGTRASMAAWQAANGYDDTGVMTTAQRAQMLDELARIEAELGLERVTENESGIEVDLPLALVEFDAYEPPFVHYREKDDSGLRVVLISKPGDRAALNGLYDVLQTLRDVPASGDRILGERSFSISARNGDTASYSFAELSQGLVKGYMVIWNPADPALEDRAARAITAIGASFQPIGGRALDPGLVPLDDGVRRGLLAGMEVRRPTVSRSGFFVSATGDVLTTTDVLQSCSRITIDRDTDAEVAAVDEAEGLALLRPTRPLAPAHHAGFADDLGRLGREVAVAGYSYEAALPAPTLTFGSLEEVTGLSGETGLARLGLAAMPGDAGGPVIDATGAVLGMLLPGGAPEGRVLPDGVAFLRPADRISASLGTQMTLRSADRNGALSPEDLTEVAAAMTVLVSCWK
ncbi:serine protease [Szabonella alba]|uniref:Trypsin-like peptidase domain-containing protein n=1 Tax=Szabonella alba TaxID=2804194 RepID=A0A8K0VEL0_9RHOB|nr:serine protease [Szabonella alba]MBL4918254.1 trypsin-like peptidase domain-containing protein [Szabonella alba]